MSLLNPILAENFFPEYIFIKPNTIKTSCGQQNTKYEAHIPAFKEFNSKDKIIFTLFDFHRFFDGLISFRDLSNMGFNWDIQGGFLKKGNTNISVYQCSPSDYDCHTISINNSEILRTPIPIDVLENGEYYIPETKVNEHCFIPECITIVNNGQGVVEIHNLGSKDTYTNLKKPLKAFPLKNYDVYLPKFESNCVYPDVAQIKQFLKLDQQNEEEKSNLLKTCQPKVFQCTDQPLSSSAQTQHVITVDTKAFRFSEIQDQIKNVSESVNLINFYYKKQTRNKLPFKFTRIFPIAQINSSVKTDTSKYFKHNLKRRKQIH